VLRKTTSSHLKDLILLSQLSHGIKIVSIPLECQSVKITAQIASDGAVLSALSMTGSSKSSQQIGNSLPESTAIVWDLADTARTKPSQKATSR
jgi:hypothetical protein